VEKPAIDRATLFRWALPVCAAVTIAPLYLAKHLPFSDLPEHVAAIATLRHYWDVPWDLQKYFVLQDLTRTQYLLYDAVAALLAVPLGSAERANLLLLSIAGLGFPYALRELLRATRRDERLAVFACPLFWNRALAEGLINYVASIPVAIFGLALVARHCQAATDAPGDRRRGTLRAIALAALSLALFYLHVSAFLLFAFGAVVFAVFVPLAAPAASRGGDAVRRVIRLPRQVVWLAPTVACAVLLAFSPAIQPDPGRQGIHAGVVRFAPRELLLQSLWPWMHDFWRSSADDLSAALLWLCFSVLLVRNASRAESAGPAERAAPFVFAAAVFLYFVMPNQVSFAFILDLRLAPFIGLLAPLVLRVRNDSKSDAALAGMFAAAMVVGGHSAWQTYAFERDEAGSFDRVMASLPRGKKLVALIFDRESTRANVSPFIHFGSYYTARYGGVSSFSFAEVPHWPIQYRDGAAPPKKKIVFWDWSPCLFRNSKDGPYYDFVLTRGELNPFAGAPPGPAWHVIGASREWTLYGRSGAPDVPLGPSGDPGPCPASPDS
jgi:hypothetical protein